MKQENLAGKVVVITGGSNGIGRETAFLFAKEGCKLVITYNKGEKEAKETAKKCIEFGSPGVLVVKLDLTKNEDIKKAVKQIIDKYGRIDILDNNAGVISWKPLEKQDYKDIEYQIRVNLEGLIKMTRECFPFIKETIINISSGAGKQGFGDLTTYCASKFGVRGFTQALADGYPKLKIYSVNPGMTATRMTEFRGVPANKVAEVVVNTVKGKYNVENGGDVDVWKVMGVGIY